MLKKKIKGIHFQPWIGKNYEKSIYGKLLLLGESHYFEMKNQDRQDATSISVGKHLSGEWKSPFFRKPGKAIDPQDWKNVWHNVAYANLIQEGMQGSKGQPTTVQIATANTAFDLLLKNLKPKKVIVLSKRMWEKWLTGGNCTHVDDLNENGLRSEVWEYKYLYGKCLGIGTCHPSARIFSSDQYVPLINKFLSTDYNIK